MTSNKKKEWNASYLNRQNFLFHPNEEIIRFFSRFVRKRIGLTDFVDILSNSEKLKMLDFGCGIGRHIIYGEKMGVDSFGIDLSDNAIEVAREWANAEGITNVEDKLLVGNGDNIPWGMDFFDIVVSHGVLDSMTFEIARGCTNEIHRVLKPKGLFYADLISGNERDYSREFCGEVVVDKAHEIGTIQSYFNFSKIQKLFSPNFRIIDAVLVKRENVIEGGFSSRYHLVLTKVTPDLE